MHQEKFVQENLGLYSISQGEGSHKSFTEFLLQIKSEGCGLFHWNWMSWHQGYPQERNSKSWSPAIHIELVMKICTTAGFQVRREEMGQAKSFCELQIKTKTLQKKSNSTIMADPFPQLWKTVLVLFISSMATSSIVLAEEENHCKWHGTAWSFS